MRTMYDGVTVSRLPGGATMVACYVDGKYANETEMRKRFPHAHIVTITVTGSADANVVDCETGDTTPATAAAWAARQVDAGRHPTIYMNASTWPDVEREVHNRGITGKVSYWVARYDNKSTVPPGAVAHQYENTPGYDVSAVADYWPGVDPAPKPSTPPPGHFTLTAEPESGRQYILRWTPSKAATSYVVWRDGKAQGTLPPTLTSHQTVVLSPGVHHFAIDARNPHGSTWSNRVTVTVR